MGAAVFGIYALIFGALSIRHVSYALLALVCMFAFEQWGAIYIPLVASNGTLVNIALLTFVAIAWFRLPAGSSFEFVQYPTRTLMIILLGYALLSTLWSPPDANATERFFNEIHYLAASLIVAPLLIRSAKDFSRVLDALKWVGGSLVVLLAFVPDFEGRSLLVDYDLEETLSLPLALGDFAGFILVIVLLRVKIKPIELMWALFVAGSSVYLITKTGSRGQLFFSIAALFICLPLRWKNFSVNKVILTVLLICIAAAAVYIVVNTENTMSSRIRAKEADALGTQSRVEQATILLDAWLADPSAMMFGLGSSASWSRNILSGYSHVVPIEVLGELGLVGFILFSASILSLFARAYTGNQKRSLSNEAARNFSALFGCWFLAFLLSCKQGTLLYSMYFFMYAALAEKCLQLEATKSKNNKRLQRSAKTRRHRLRRSL